MHKCKCNSSFVFWYCQASKSKDITDIDAFMSLKSQNGGHGSTFNYFPRFKHISIRYTSLLGKARIAMNIAEDRPGYYDQLRPQLGLHYFDHVPLMPLLRLKRRKRKRRCRQRWNKGRNQGCTEGWIQGQITQGRIQGQKCVQR